ncbi:MAG TPA: cupin domain-containing protein [Chthoniobacteraceae bacterium]|nr:cupin domain-containing protein [Chthoniobacteraceae bacterium]
MNNLFDSLPKDLGAEIFEEIIRSSTVRIERIISKGHASPESGWYDQEEHEWVVVLKGRARLEFEEGAVHELLVGDYVNIPAHARHKVAWTTPDEPTIWLAVFYR